MTSHKQKTLQDLLNKLQRSYLLTLIYDYFPEVYASIKRSTRSDHLITSLLNSCKDKNELFRLLSTIKKDYPDLYTEHESEWPQPQFRLVPEPVQPFEIQLRRHKNDTLIQVLKSVLPDEPPITTFQTPFSGTAWSAIAKALHTKIGPVEDNLFQTDQKQALIERNLLFSGSNGDFLLKKLYESVGESLYEALLPKTSEARRVFERTLDQTNPNDKAIELRLKFEASATVEASYPWELMYDQQQFLLHREGHHLTRYIAFDRPLPQLDIETPIRVLYVASHPHSLPLLDNKEQQAVLKNLQAHIDNQLIEFDLLATPATHDELAARLRKKRYHYVHFDGHGAFCYLCPFCNTANSPISESCTNCGYPVSMDGPPQGYLIFEKENQDSDYVSAASLKTTFDGSGVQLVILSACESGRVRGSETLFGSVGPSLIQVGIPAVLSMQYLIQVEAAVNFFGAFYQALTDGESLADAVRLGRRLLYRDEQANPQSWFIPALYLRYQNT